MAQLVHLLVNAASRRGARDGRRVAAILRREGHDVVPVAADTAEAVAPELLRRRASMQRLVIVGGDGLINHAIQAMAETAVPIGVVSSGTGNDFARSLGLPRRLPDSLHTALGEAGRVDLLRVTRSDGTVRWAATVLTGGFSGRVNQTADRLRFPRGQQKYTAATLLEIPKLSPFTLALGVDEAPVDHSDCTLFAIGNTSHFGGGMAICPDADPNDGLLDITLVDEVSRFTLLRVLPMVFSGQHVRRPEVRQFSGASATLAHDQEVWADGERIGRGPMTVEIVSDALRVAGFRAEPPTLAL